MARWLSAPFLPSAKRYAWVVVIQARRVLWRFPPHKGEGEPLNDYWEVER